MEYLYEWMRNLAFYLVLLTAVLHLIANETYRKYIQFFTGLILVLLIAGPIFKIFGMEQKMVERYESLEYEQKIKEIEEATKYLNEWSLEKETAGEEESR